MVKPVQFTRESGCLAHDEFLVIFDRDHSLIYMYVQFCNCVIFGHCITLHLVVCVGYLQSRIDFSITWQNLIYHVMQNDHLVGCTG